MYPLRLIVFLVCCVIALPIYAQESNENNFATKHELSIVIDDIFSDNYAIEDYYMDNSSVDWIAPKIGLGYKFHFANSAIRSKVLFGIKDNVSDVVSHEIKNESSYKSLKAFVGYELHKNLTKTQLFYGLDVFINYNHLTSKESFQYNSQIVSINNELENFGFGVIPLIGVKYFFSPMLSISTEVKYQIESYTETRIYSNIYSEGFKTKVTGLNTTFGPLGQLSINIHF